MANLPLGLSYSLHQNLQEFKEEGKIVEHLENHPLDLKDFINAFAQDLAWVNNQKNKGLDREIIRLTLENPAIEAETVLKIFEVIEKSDSFKEIFHEEMKSFPALFDRCFKVLKANRQWMDTHQAATQSIMKQFIYYHIDENSPDLQKKVNELASFIPPLSLFKAADTSELLVKAISRKNASLVKMLIEQGILEHERLNKSSLLTAAISSASFEIFKLLIDHGVAIEEDGSRDIQQVISKYGELESFLKKYGNAYGGSDTREEINDLKRIAFFLVASGYKIPEEKKKSSFSFGSSGRGYGGYSSYNNYGSSEDEFRKELVQFAKLHQELTTQEPLPHLGDLNTFYKWASHFPDIHSWMDQRSPMVLSSLLNSTKASSETQRGLLKILEETGLLSSEIYSHLLKHAIDQNPSLLKTLCQFKPPDSQPKADLDHLTPLQYAFKKGSIESASILFDFDSNPNIALPGSRTSFFSFIISKLNQFKGEHSPALILLNKSLQHNADLQNLPRDQAEQIWNDLMRWKDPGSEEIICQLLDRGLPFLTIRDTENQDSPLMMALKHKKFKLAEKLMAMGAHTPLINAPDNQGATPLSLALEIGEENLIQFLLDDGADISSLQSDWQLRQIEEFRVRQEKQDPKEALRDLINPKNLANLLADSFMKDMRDERGERLEGNNFVQSLNFINSLLGTVMQEAETNPEMKQLLINKKNQRKRFMALSKQLARCAEFADQLTAIQAASPYKKKGMLQAFSKRVSHQITGLKEGESLVLPSGWSAETGGHAMLCVFRCTGPGKYDCLSINTGDGAEHHAFLPKPNKTYINPVCCYKDLSQEEATDSAFLQVLFEPRINPEQKDSNYSSADLYDGIFARFKDKLVATSPEMNVYVTAQRSGSCSVRVLLAYMHVMLGEESYKPAAYLLKRTALSAAIEDESRLKDQPVLQHILRKSAESLCRNILKLSKDTLRQPSFEDRIGEMTLEEVFDALAEEKINLRLQKPFSEETLLSLLERLEKKIRESDPGQSFAPLLPIREAARGLITAFQVFNIVGTVPSSAGTRHPDFSFPTAPALNTLPFSESLTSLFKQAEKSPEIVSAELQPSGQPSLKILSPSHIAELRGSGLVDYLQDTRKFCLAQSQGTARDREIAVELATQTLLSLPLPTLSMEETWGELSVNQAQSSLLHIYALSRDLLFNMQSSPIAFPERMIALYKAQAIAFRLACQIEREKFPDKEVKLEHFCINYMPLLNLQTDVHNVIYDTQTRHQLNELLGYMARAHSSQSDSYTLFDYAKWKREEPDIQLPIPKDSGEYFYLQDIHDSIPNWEKEDKEYEGLSYEIRNKFSREDWHLAKLWEGRTRHLPAYFLIQRDLSFFSQILENVSSPAWQDYCNYSPDQHLIEIDTSNKAAKVSILSKGKWARSTLLRTGRHTPTNTDPSNSYSSAHFAFEDREKSKALHPQESQNAYTIKYKSDLESLLSLTSQPLLTPYHIRMWLSSHLNDILDRDNQVFCNLALFAEGRLSAAIKENPALTGQYMETIEKSLAELSFMMAESKKGKQSLTEEEINYQAKLSQAQLFFYQLKLRLLDHAQEAGKASKEEVGSSIKEEVAKTRNHLKERLLSFPTAEPKQASFQRSTHLILASSYLNFPPQDWQEVESLIEHSFYAQFYASLSKESDPSAEQGAKSALFSSLPLINDSVNLPHLATVFNRILENIYGIPTPPSLDWTMEFPICKTNLQGALYEINLVTCEVKKDGVRLNQLEAIYEDPDYRHAFGSKRFLSSSIIPQTDTNAICYEVLDEKGQPVHFFVPKKKESFWGKEEDTGSSLRMERIMDGIPYLYIPWEKAPRYPQWPALPKQPNKDHYVLWQSLEDSHIRVLDKQSQEAAYIFTQEGKIQLPSGTAKEWIDIENMTGSEALAHFESPAFIFALQSKENQEISLNFCRYCDSQGSPLQFTQKMVESGRAEETEEKASNLESKLVWNADPQFFISQKQELSGIPNYHQFLILENASGQKKALIPVKTYSTEKNHSLEGPPFTFEYEIIDLAGNKLNPKTPKQHAVSAYLSLMHRNYEDAFSYLDKAYHLQRYKSEDLKYLGWIIHSQEENADFDPNAIAVRNYASWLVSDNLFRNPRLISTKQTKVETPSEIKSLYQKEDDWDNYLSGKGYWKRAPTLGLESISKNSFSDYASRLYASYLNIRRNVNVEFRLDSSKKGAREARLTRQQEIIWLQDLLKIHCSGQLALRFAALAELEQFDSDLKTYTPLIQIKPPDIALIPIQDRYSRSSSSSPLGSQKARTPAEAAAAVLEIFPRTRPGKHFLDQFLNFYLIATKGNEEQKKILLHLLYDMRHEPNPQNQGYRALLEAIILQHPLSAGIMRTIDALKEGRIRDEKTAFKDLEEIAGRYLQSAYASDQTKHPYVIQTKERIRLASSYIPVLPSPPPSFPSEEDRLTLAFSPDLRKTAKEKGAIGQSSYKKVVSPKDHEPFPKYEPKTSYGQERYRRLVEDYQEGCRKSDEAASFIFSQATDFRQWKAELEKQEIEEMTAPLFLFENILKLANKSPSINEQTAQYLSHQLKQTGKKQALVSFSDLVAAFAQQSKAGYHNLNPALSGTEVEELHNMIGSFIANALDLRQNKNKISVLDKLIQQIEAKSGKDIIKETMQELGELMELDSADEEYLSSAPILVFNYLMNKRVRPDQINDLKTMLGVESLEQARSQFPNLFTQKIMGGGKTLVLGTLMSLLKADGYHLSILIPPPSLYDTNAQDMKIRSEKLFGQKTATFMYKRDPAYFNMAYLSNGYQMLVQAIEKKNSIILSPESLEAMENEYWGKREELRVLYQAKAELLGAENRLEAERVDQQIQAISRPLKVLKETLKLIKARGVFTFDEVDLTLNCRKELNFPIGDSISLPRYANEMLADLFLLAATDRDVLQAGLRLRENKQSELHPVQYEKIKEILSKKFIAQLIASDKWCERLFINQEVLRKYRADLLSMEGNPLENSLNEIIKESASVLNTEELSAIYAAFGPNPSLEEIEKFFSERSLSLLQLEERLRLAKEYGNLHFIADIHAFITDLDKPAPDYLHSLHQSSQPMQRLAADLYTLLRQELNEWLQESWKKSAGEHYGFSRIHSTKSIAIPYSANNKPSENSEFADPWETANRTLQLYLSNGLKFEQTIELIEVLQKKVRFEWSQAGYPPHTSDMPTAQAFFKATGLELLAINRGQTDRIHHVQQALLKGEEAGLELMLAYVVDHVLPTIKIYSEQITHNAQNLASMPKVKQGYTGTMESADTFPDDVQVNLDKGTNGKVLEVLLRANKTVHVVEEGNVQDHLKQVLGWPSLINPHAAQFRALIDLGPVYKGCSSEQIAADILAFMESHPDQAMHAVKGVLYWDDASNMLCCIKSGETEPTTLPATDPETIYSFTGLKQEQLFAFYPHHKLTGADLVLPKDAYVLSTFSNATPLRDVLQGDMRARGIFKNQHVETMLPRSALPLIGDEIGKPGLPQEVTETTPDSSIISISDLIPFAEFNEAERQRMDYPRSTLQKISNHIKEAVLQELYEIENDEEENRLFEKARHLAIRKHSLALFEKFAQSRKGEISSEQFLLRRADECLIPLTGYPLRQIISLNGELLPESDQLSPALIAAYQRINQTIQRALSKLPPTMPQSGNLEWGREATVEQLEETSTQQHQEQQTDYYVELDTFQQIQTALKPAQEHLWQAGQFQALAAEGPAFASYPLQHPDQPSIWPLHDILEHHSHLKKYAHCFDKGISVSENFLRTVENAANLFNLHQKPVYNVLAILNPQTNKWDTVLVTLEEAAFFKSQLAKKEDLNFSMWLLEPEGGVIQSGSKNLGDLSSAALNSLDKSLIPVLFFMGNAKSLNADRWFNHFKEWAQEDKKLKKDLLEAVILGGEESEQRHYYQDSRLELLLNEFSSEEAFKTESSSVLPEELELGMLAVNNGRAAMALDLLNKASRQMDANNPVHLNALVALTGQTIKHASKLSEKRQARDLLITGLKQIIQLIQTEKIYSCLENLALLKGINDPAINHLLCEISLILIKEGQIDLAVQVALSQIPSFKAVYPSERLFKNPLFIQQIRTIRASTLKILQTLGEIEPPSFAQTEAIKQINQSLKDALSHEEKPLICDLVVEQLNHPPENNLSGIEEMAIYALTSTYKTIRDQISDTYFGNKQGKDTSAFIAEIEAAFFRHSKSMPALANKGKELLGRMADSVIDYYDKVPKPSCLPLARDFYNSRNAFAIEIAKDLLRRFKKTPAWKKCTTKEIKLVNRILQSADREI